MMADTLMQPESVKCFTLGFCPPSPKSWSTSLWCALFPAFLWFVLHARPVACSSFSVFLEWTRFFANDVCTAHHLRRPLTHKRASLRFFEHRLPRRPLVVGMVLSLFSSVLNRDAHVVEVCGKVSVVQIHSARTQNRHTIHVAADAAGLLPICHPVSRVPLERPFQSKAQPPSPFPLSVFPPPTWSHMGPSCPSLPPAPIFHDGLSAPHVLPTSPPFCGHSDEQCQY